MKAIYTCIRPKCAWALAAALIVTLLPLAGCKETNAQQFSLTIAAWKPLGAKAGEPLPDTIRSIITPLVGKDCPTLFVPKPSVCRVGPEACEEIKPEKTPRGGDMSNPKLLARLINTSVEKFQLTPRLVDPTMPATDVPATIAAFMATQPPNAEVIYQRANGFHVTVEEDKKTKTEILPSVKELHAFLLKKLCSGTGAVVILTGVPDEPAIVPPVVATDTDTIPDIPHEGETPDGEPPVGEPPAGEVDVEPEVEEPPVSDTTRPVSREVVPCREQSVQVAPGVFAPRNMCPPGYTGPDENCKCHAESGRSGDGA